MKKMMAEIGIDIALGVFAILIIYVAVGGFGTYRPLHKLRAKVGGAWQKKGLTVALVWPPNRESGFIEGAMLAFDENNAAGNTLSKRIRIRMFKENDSVDGTRVAQEIASYPDVVAVLGHESSSSAIGASVVYENHGILFIAPNPTSPRLTIHGFQYVFRM